MGRRIRKVGKWKRVMEKRSSRDALCGGRAGKEMRFLEAGGPVRKLKAEFAWLDGLFMGSGVKRKEREQQGDENDIQERK